MAFQRASGQGSHLFENIIVFHSRHHNVAYHPDFPDDVRLRRVMPYRLSFLVFVSLRFIPFFAGRFVKSLLRSGCAALGYPPVS